MHIESCAKGTHTNERMTFFLKGFFSWRFFACSWDFKFVVEWIPAIRNNAEITCSPKYHSHYCSSTWFCSSNKQFLQLALFSAVIHKRREQKLICKSTKYKLDSSSEMRFAFFLNLKAIQSLFFGKLAICSKIWKWHK